MAEEYRAPIVTFLGHIDHGKTTLADFIRKTSIAAHERGGITQAIVAYQAMYQGKLITLIDTPGHAVFEKMRSRGAKVADIAILVIAVDDGVMSQTVEAIKHIQSANIPIIVAINKIDLPGVNIAQQVEKIKHQLSDNKVLVEEYGGDVPVVQLSAKTGEGVDKLMEMILIVAEFTEIKGDPTLTPQGVVIESNLDKFKGPVATVILRNGTLRKNDQILLDGVRSKIRGLLDYTGKPIESASPSTPVELLGLEKVPNVGEVLGKERESKQPKGVQSLVEKLRESQEKLNVIAKADKVGSLEAIEDAISDFNTNGEIIKLISKGTGDISEKDVELATATKAFIIGFNVRVVPQAQKIAETEHILIRTYNIIYELLAELKDLIEGMLAGELKEETFGLAQIVAQFPYGKNDRIAGCKVLDGVISKGPKVKILRENKETRGSQVIGEGKIRSIKHLKEEVAKIEKGQECGIMFDSLIDFKVGDIIQSYRTL